MDRTLAALFALTLLPCSPAFPAEKSFDLTPPHRWLWRHRPPQPYYVPAAAGFRMEILGEYGGAKAESTRHGRPFVAARNEERYSVRLFNPLPVRVAVNLTVDGVNSISGKPSGISDGDKWMIEPYGSIVIRGWQVSGGEARRFFFTDKPKSYAKWRGDALGRDLAANCGVIGAAFFWNQAELDAAYAPPPPYDPPVFSAPGEPSYPSTRGGDDAPPNLARKAKPADRQAGTGMGEREWNPTTSVEFHFDRGMYRVDQALLVYYDFAPEPSEPNAFPGPSGFAPEM